MHVENSKKMFNLRLTSSASEHLSLLCLREPSLLVNSPKRSRLTDEVTCGCDRSDQPFSRRTELIYYTEVNIYGIHSNRRLLFLSRLREIHATHLPQDFGAASSFSRSGDLAARSSLCVLNEKGGGITRENGAMYVRSFRI